MSESVVVGASMDNYDTVEAWSSMIHHDAYMLLVSTNSGGILLTKAEVTTLIDGLQKLIGEDNV